MKAGNFNINEYLEKLYENQESGNLSGSNKEGLIIPDENKKSYDWLKREYNKSQTTVKVEISGAGASFKPGYDLQTSIDSAKEFKPGAFGDTGEKDTTDKNNNKEEKKSNLDPKKDSKSFTKTEGESKKIDSSKTNNTKDNIKNKEGDKQEEPPKNQKPEIKKIDLKTKKE